jgi:hypothetical protein
VTPYLIFLANFAGRIGADPVGRDDARRRAHAELSHSIYHRYDDPWPVRAVRWIEDALGKLFDSAASHSPGGGLGAIAFVAALLALIALAFWRLGPMSRTAHVSVDVLADTTLTAAAHRRRAAAAADRAEWKTAVIEQMRALARDLEQRALLDPRPGRTADELAAEAGRMLPAVRELLTTAANTFDTVVYGDRGATEADYETVRRADESVAAARPVELAPA